MRKRKDPTAEQLVQYAHDLAEASAVLDGRVRPLLIPAAQKICHFLFSADCDAIVSNQGFLVQHEGGRRFVDYISGAAPSVLFHLVRWADGQTPCAELRAAPIAAQAPKHLLAPALRTGGKHLLWLRNGAEVIRFALRRDSEELRGAGWPPPVTAKPFKPPTPVYVVLDPARPCPHCGMVLSRVRDLGYMICSSCGRSFTSWDPSNPNRRR